MLVHVAVKSESGGLPQVDLTGQDGHEIGGREAPQASTARASERLVQHGRGGTSCGVEAGFPFALSEASEYEGQGVIHSVRGCSPERSRAR